MGISREDIRKSIIGFVFVIVSVSGVWVYLDRKHDNLLDLEREVLKKNAELEIAELKLSEREKNLNVKEALIETKGSMFVKAKQKLYSNESLDNLISEYIKSYSDIDLNNECRNKPEYMAKYREAKSFLEFIEAKAHELEREDIILNFIQPKRGGIHTISYKCP
jgi:hypothetical protein